MVNICNKHWNELELYFESELEHNVHWVVQKWYLWLQGTSFITCSTLMSMCNKTLHLESFPAPRSGGGNDDVNLYIEFGCADFQISILRSLKYWLRY